MTKYRDAKPCNASMGEIQKYAEEVATKLKFKPGASIEKVVLNLGGKIEYQTFSELEQSVDCSILIDGIGKFTIFLPDYTSHVRDRFSIAHELGHYFLHFPLDKSFKPMKAARYGSNRVEWEANWFAAGFLMPRVAFEAAYKKLKSVDDVASHFKVSSQAADIRKRVILGV